MIKKSLVASILLLVFGSALALAQDAPSDINLTGARYTVASDASLEESNRVLSILESNFSFYQRWIPLTPGSPMLVKIFRNKDAYDAALAQKGVAAAREDFIYMYYGDATKNTLYLYGGTDAATLRRRLNRHGFMEFLFALDPGVPSWLREGFALYFEGLSTDASGVTALSSGDYLDNVRKLFLAGDAVSVAALTSMTDDAFRPSLEKNLIYSWALVEFMAANSDASLGALLGRVAASLDPKKSAADNLSASAAILASRPTLQSEFTAYLTNARGFQELTDGGRAAYEKGDLESALAIFTRASSIRRDRYSPAYYLGLIAYAKKDYAGAETRYKEAAAKGAPPALIAYATGMNAYATGDKGLAKSLLTEAKSGDYARYGVLADATIALIDAGAK